MAWTTPKTDWTESSFFNVVDWNRIKDNVTYLADELEAFGYIRPGVVDIGLGRGTMSLPTYDLVNSLETNLLNLKNVLGTIAPDVETWHYRLSSLYNRNPDYSDWNRWETTLKQVNTDLQHIRDSWVYCGEINCGGTKL